MRDISVSRRDITGGVKVEITYRALPWVISVSKSWFSRNGIFVWGESYIYLTDPSQVFTVGEGQVFAEMWRIALKEAGYLDKEHPSGSKKDYQNE